MTRQEIQSICPPVVKIDQDDIKWFDSMCECLKSAKINKGDLIELLFEFEQEGNLESPWIAEIVASDEWIDSVHNRLWETWDGDFDTMGTLINRAFNELYPL